MPAPHAHELVTAAEPLQCHDCGKVGDDMCSCIVFGCTYACCDFGCEDETEKKQAKAS